MKTCSLITEDLFAHYREPARSPGNVATAPHPVRITRLGAKPALLATLFGVDQQGLAGKAIKDPHEAVTVDVAALKASSSE